VGPCYVSRGGAQARARARRQAAERSWERLGAAGLLFRRRVNRCRNRLKDGTSLVLRQEGALRSPLQPKCCQLTLQIAVQGLLPHPPRLRVLALNGSYHGDTLGAANAQAPSVFNGPTQAPWYTSCGVFLDPPTVELAADGWRVVLPHGFSAPAATGAVPIDAGCFTEAELFSTERDTSSLCQAYRAIVTAALADAALHGDGAVGAAIIEPVLHGASGMTFIDPAFQRAVAAVCQAQQVPLIADEVFSGLWRFGVISASQLLGVKPDVACYAKLLTGGTVPLAATLSTEEVFDAFRGSEKTDALLHGHSYSAHAIGCAAACSALDIFADAATNPNLVPGAGALHICMSCAYLFELNRATLPSWGTFAGAVGS